MELELLHPINPAPIDIDIIADAILREQKASGEIPWHEGGKTDPWDHVESAIGLSIAGYVDEAQRAFRWLASIQLEDGSWSSAYKNGEILDDTKESNQSTYIAVGVYHHYLITHDKKFLKEIWPSVERGIEYALELQAESGEIYWARNVNGIIDPMALLTGCSSIFMSLKCALACASILGLERPHWEIAMDRLGNAIRNKPQVFNQEKARYSMDWFYPILTGAITGKAAEARLDSCWNKFMVENLGVRCVSDSPWVTVAESSELIMAIAATGNSKLARKIFGWVSSHCYDDGSYWCGVTFPDGVIWPEEKLSWTNAAVIMAADVLYQLTPACRLFTHAFWEMSQGVHPHTFPKVISISERRQERTL